MKEILSTVQQVAFGRAVKTLDALGAAYKIILPDGQEFGTLKIQREEEISTRKKKPLMYPRNTIRKYAEPYLDSIQVGDVACIPFGEFKPEVLATQISGIAGKLWGRGNYVTCMVRASKHVEVMRTN